MGLKKATRLTVNRSKMLQSRRKAGLAPTHYVLGRRFRSLGESFAEMKNFPSEAVRIPDIPLHKNGIFFRLYKATKKNGVVNLDKFGDSYRRSWDKQDELLSTSSVREIIAGILVANKKSSMSPSLVHEVSEQIDTISRVRFPSAFSGFATKTSVMQHPTAKGQGVFADPRKTASAHSTYDLDRKAAIVDEMYSEKQMGSSMQTIVKAGLRRAISYTLNEFTAPSLAGDVRPYISKGVSAERALVQTEAREALKATFVLLGGEQETGPNRSRRRNWTQRQGKGLRSASPIREVA